MSITQRSLPFAALILSVGLTGCSSAPPTTQTGFLSDYSRLKEVTPNKMNWVSRDLSSYRSFIIDPIQVRVEPGEFSAADRTEVATHFRDELTRVLVERGYTVTTKPHANTARVRIAITDIKKSTWWMKVHPVSSLSGAGRGGAAIEAEVIDATTGQQLGAVVQAGTGSQFTLFNYSTLSDLKNTVSQWAEQAGDRLDELRRNGK